MVGTVIRHHYHRIYVHTVLVMDGMQAPGSSFVSGSGGFLTSTNVMSPHMSSWHMPMPDHVTGSQGGDMLSSSLNDSYLSSYFTRSATHSNDIQQQVGNLSR